MYLSDRDVILTVEDIDELWRSREDKVAVAPLVTFRLTDKDGSNVGVFTVGLTEERKCNVGDAEPWPEDKVVIRVWEW